MNNNPISNVDPDGDLPFLALAGIGAATGIFSNGLSNISSGQGFFDGALRAGLVGAFQASFSFGIGGAAAGLSSSWSPLGVSAFQAGAHGITGGNFGSGFLSGASSSSVSSIIGDSDFQIVGGGISGGIGSAIGGGNFFQGFGQGIAVSAFNHTLHNSSDWPWPKKQKIGIDYNGDGVISNIEVALTAAEVVGYGIDILTIPSGEGAALGLFIRGIGRNLAPKTWKLYSKATFKAYEKQLKQHGKKSLIDSRNSLLENIDIHLNKLVDIQKNGGYSSSVHREIASFRSQIQAIDKLLGF